MELNYHKCGDYYLPDLIPPENPKISKYGLLRWDYLKKHKKPIYTGMLLSGKLNAHLEEVDAQAEQMMDELCEQYSKAEGVNEKLKATDQMAWVGAMNSIQSRAEEIVLRELIYR